MSDDVVTLTIRCFDRASFAAFWRAREPEITAALKRAIEGARGGRPPKDEKPS
jgi:hypothetical protein